MRTRYVMRDGKLVEVKATKPGAHNIIRDCYSSNPVRSPVDGTLLDSRAKLREHNARNGCVDVGNDPAFNAVSRQGKAYEPDRQAIREDVRSSMARHGWAE